jgi:hypothetical protein
MYQQYGYILQAPLSDSNSMSLMPPLSPELEMENMSPTFLENQSHPSIFDTPVASSGKKPNCFFN